MNTDSRSHRSIAFGFTLLEVMIALAVFAISAIALLSGTNQSINQSSYLEEKSYALWIAENTLTELRLKPQWPSLGRDNRQLSLFNRDWQVDTDVSASDEKSLRRVQVSVSRSADAKILCSLQGYIGQH